MRSGRDVKPCPYCGEEILMVAVRCKHCQADLSGGGPGPAAAKAPVGEGLGIAHLLVPVGATVLIWLWVGSMSLLQDPQSTLALITVTTLLATGALAAVEASRLGIGSESDRNEHGRKRSGPATWFIFHLVLWILAFPSYLYWRSKYGAKNMVIGGLVVALLFTGTAIGMTAAIEAKKSEIRDRLEQAW